MKSHWTSASFSKNIQIILYMITYQMYLGVVGFIPPVLLSVDYNGIIGLHSLMSSKLLVVPF